MMLGKHITPEQAAFSQTAIRRGIDNSVPAELLPAGIALCNNVYDPLCEKLNIQVPFSSFYRCQSLNRILGGAKNSKHTLLEAVDLDADGFAKVLITNSVIFWTILKSLPFDQLIWEFGNDKNPAWVHVSYSLNHNRHEVLRSRKNADGETVYSHFNMEGISQP